MRFFEFFDKGEEWVQATIDIYKISSINYQKTIVNYNPEIYAIEIYVQVDGKTFQKGYSDFEEGLNFYQTLKFKWKSG